MTHKGLLLDVGESITIGGGGSLGMAAIWPETLHGMAVLITGVVTAIVVFFINRWLRKKFPG